MDLKIIVIGLIIGWVQAEDSEITKAMKKYKVIPDLLDEGPKDLLKVSFESGVVANMGEELTPTQVQNPPKIEWIAEDDAYYTLLFTEPDGPASVIEWHHWLVVNIPGNDMEKGDVLSGYQGSAPGKDSGFNRYVFLLFKQPKKLEFDKKYSAANSVEGRPNFSTRKFSAKYDLGSPVAGNFYRAQYDQYSDVLLAILGLI